MANTTLIDKHPGAVVNLETDVIGKYVHSFTTAHTGKRSGITMERCWKMDFKILFQNRRVFYYGTH